jgi:hypothetical protein
MERAEKGNPREGFKIEKRMRLAATRNTKHSQQQTALLLSGSAGGQWLLRGLFL